MAETPVQSYEELVKTYEDAIFKKYYSDIQKAFSLGQECIFPYKMDKRECDILKKKGFVVLIEPGNCDHHFCSCGSKTIIKPY